VKWLLGSKNNSFDDAQKKWISTKTKDEDFIDEVFEKIKYLEEQFHS
jgi:myo-inositol catabolism protein IolC